MSKKKASPGECANNADLYSSMAVETIPKVNRINVAYDEKTGATSLTFQVAGNLSVETCGNVFAPDSAGTSSNYGSGTDGRIGMYVEEKILHGVACRHRTITVP